MAAEFERYTEHAAKIAHEIEGHLVALGLDWRDEFAMRGLAREVLDVKDPRQAGKPGEDAWQQKGRVELHGLIGLMLQTMTESATIGYEVHGGECWKALARALWAEKEAQDTDPVSRGTK